MAIPDYQSLMLPLLQFTREKSDETSTGESVDFLAKKLGLTENDLKEMLFNRLFLIEWVGLPHI